MGGPATGLAPSPSPRRTLPDADDAQHLSGGVAARRRVQQHLDALAALRDERELEVVRLHALQRLGEHRVHGNFILRRAGAELVAAAVNGTLRGYICCLGYICGAPLSPRATPLHGQCGHTKYIGYTRHIGYICGAPRR